MEKKILVLSANQFRIGVLPEGDIAFRFDLADSSVGLMPELDISIRVSHTEARQLAQLLNEKAAEAEESTPE